MDDKNTAEKDVSSYSQTIWNWKVPCQKFAFRYV